MGAFETLEPRQGNTGMGQGMAENGRVGKQGRQDAELDSFFELNAK